MISRTGTDFHRGTVFRNIRLTSKDGEVECRDGRGTMVLKTEFLKKA